MTTSTATERTAPTAVAQREPFLRIHAVPIYFDEDWRRGIGGGLWSTGLALARYFATDHAAASLRRLSSSSSSSSSSIRGEGLAVLELGSGNGFLAVCLAALAASQNIRIKDLVVTDVGEDHLDMIQATIAANQHTVRTVETVIVTEHIWGKFSTTNGLVNGNGAATTIEQAVSDGTKKFDWIVGSDVAYRETLYDPLIRSIQQFSHSTTVSLIGVTMADTTPEFFDRLDKAGLSYQKFADNLLEPEYRGTTFGIFVIQQIKKM